MKKTEVLRLFGEKTAGGKEADRKEEESPKCGERKDELSMEELESVSGGI